MSVLQSICDGGEFIMSFFSQRHSASAIMIERSIFLLFR